MSPTQGDRRRALQSLVAAADGERERIRRLLFVTINGIAAGLHTTDDQPSP